MNSFIKRTGGRIYKTWNRAKHTERVTDKVYKAGYHPLPPEIITEFNKSRSLGPQSCICYAPFKMMYFAFGGEVIACCHNRKNIMGIYPDQSITEIWEGHKYNQLREFIDNDDLSMGCEVCKTHLLSRNFDGAKNALYDRYSAKEWPVTMEFELDNTCNLACIICNDLFSSKIPGEKNKQSPYNEAFVTQLEPFIPHLKETKFYGGEPFLIPVYYSIWDKIITLNPRANILVQTNGTVLNEKVKTYLARGKFSINVSIDSLNKKNFEKIRANADFDNTLENTKWFGKYCKEKGTHFGIIPTPNRLNWQDLPEITLWANELGARVYFNTLITPLELALWNLGPDQLTQIHEDLSKISFPAKTAIQKANKRHFHDFLLQILAWKDVNSRQELSEKLRVSRSELLQVKNRFLQRLNDSLKENNDRQKLMDFFNQVISSLGAHPQNDLIFMVLEKIPMEEIISEISCLNFEHVQKTAGKKLFEASGQYIITEA
jgi:MoaA/NifB/PqqE/SkfB family radical SAM enzyme